jgi:hypothetical protein
MLDVHPPHEAAHTWKDFFVHIGTISIGLLIALTLEAGVEALHHRSIVREARENIRRELEQNLAETSTNNKYLLADRSNMEGNLDLLKQLRLNPQALDHQTMHFDISWSGFNDSAWHSARDSGALTYMPTQEVQDYSDLYDDQEVVNKQALEIFTQQSLVTVPLRIEPDLAKVSPEDIDRLLRGCSETLIRLELLQQLTTSLKNSYTETLKGP